MERDYLFRDGDRVRSVKWRTNGTVKTVGGVKEVRWDDSFVADELDLVRTHLIHWD
jgi:hypothetical protein